QIHDEIEIGHATEGIATLEPERRIRVRGRGGRGTEHGPFGDLGVARERRIERLGVSGANDVRELSQPLAAFRQTGPRFSEVGRSAGLSPGTSAACLRRLESRRDEPANGTRDETPATLPCGGTCIPVVAAEKL